MSWRDLRRQWRCAWARRRIPADSADAHRSHRWGDDRSELAAASSAISPERIHLPLNQGMPRLSDALIPAAVE